MFLYYMSYSRVRRHSTAHQRPLQKECTSRALKRATHAPTGSSACELAASVLMGLDTEDTGNTGIPLYLDST